MRGDFLRQLVVFPPLAWGLADALAEGTDEARGGTEACHRGDLLHRPREILLKQTFCAIHALIEEVLVWRLAGDSAEVSREVKWTEMDLAGDLIKADVAVEICGDVLHCVAKLWQRKTALDPGLGSGICCVAAQ